MTSGPAATTGPGPIPASAAARHEGYAVVPRRERARRLCTSRAHPKPIPMETEQR